MATTVPAVGSLRQQPNRLHLSLEISYSGMWDAQLEIRYGQCRLLQHLKLPVADKGVKRTLETVLTSSLKGLTRPEAMELSTE